MEVREWAADLCYLVRAVVRANNINRARRVTLAVLTKWGHAVSRTFPGCSKVIIVSQAKCHHTTTKKKRTH